MTRTRSPRYPRSARACQSARQLIRGAAADAHRAAQVLIQTAAIVGRLPERPNVALSARLAADLLASAAGLLADVRNQVAGIDRHLYTIANGVREDDQPPPPPPAAPSLPLPDRAAAPAGYPPLSAAHARLLRSHQTWLDYCAEFNVAA
jgi:hypothetical protein